MRLLFLLFLIFMSLHAESINNSVLKIQAALFPKIILMDYQFREKLDNGYISIAILHRQKDYRYALRLKDKIEKKYKDGIKNIPIKVVVSTYKQMHKNVPLATAYYLFSCSEVMMKEAITLANSHDRLSFVYDGKNLKHGAMIAVKIEEKVKPYININALKQEGVSLRPMLLNISELFMEYRNKTLLENYSDRYAFYYL